MLVSVSQCKYSAQCLGCYMWCHVCIAWHWHIVTLCGNSPSWYVRKPSAGKGCNSSDLVILLKTVIPIIVYKLGLYAGDPHSDAQTNVYIKGLKELLMRYLSIKRYVSNWGVRTPVKLRYTQFHYTGCVSPVSGFYVSFKFVLSPKGLRTPACDKGLALASLTANFFIQDCVMQLRYQDSCQVCVVKI